MSKASEEAQKQLDRIVALGYPDVADMSAAAFRSLARPLIRALEDCGDEAGLGTQILLVPTRELVSPESLIARTSINRMAGFTTMPPRDIASFLPQDGFEPPEGPFYLVIEPHTGTCYINREPDVARKLIDSDERLPLTLEEGLAIATQHPEWLLEKNGFNLLGSRSADGRVPSIWMSQNAPRLGAVWPNSRHTWLGNACIAARTAVCGATRGTVCGTARGTPCRTARFAAGRRDSAGPVAGRRHAARSAARDFGCIAIRSVGAGNS